MRLNRNHLFNFLGWSALVFALAGLQTTLWPYFLGNAPLPQLWLMVAVYLILYRPLSVSFFMVYYVGLIAAAFTAAPLGILLATLALITGSVAYVKRGLFWPNTRYFVIASLASSILFHVFYFLLSQLQEENSANLIFGTRLLEIIMTVLFAIPIYWLMKALDRWTLTEGWTAEVETSIE